MVRNVLEQIGGIGIYGIVSMLLFFAVFVGAVILVITMKQPHRNHMKMLPLDAEDESAGDTRHDG